MKKKMWLQRLFGIILLFISIIICYMAKTGYDSDVTAILLTLPLGFWLLFSKQYLLTL